MERRPGWGVYSADMELAMTYSEPRQRPSTLRFTRTMAAPLRQQYPVDSDETVDEFTQLLEIAERRRQQTGEPQKR